MMIPRSAVIETARSLASEHGENPEYDRALVEMVMRLSGATEDDRAAYVALILPQPDYGLHYYGENG